MRGDRKWSRRYRAAAVAEICDDVVVVASGRIPIADADAAQRHSFVAGACILVGVGKSRAGNGVATDQRCAERLQIRCRCAVGRQAVIGFADSGRGKGDVFGADGADGATGTGAGQNVIADVRSADGQTLHRHGFSGRGVLVAVRAVGRIAQRDGVARLYPGQRVVAGGKVGGGIGAVVHLGDGVGEADRQGLGINRQDTVGVAGSGNYIVFFIGTGQVTIRAQRIRPCLVFRDNGNRCTPGVGRDAGTDAIAVLCAGKRGGECGSSAVGGGLVSYGCSDGSSINRQATGVGVGDGIVSQVGGADCHAGVDFVKTR